MGGKVSSEKHSRHRPVKGWSCEVEPSGSEALTRGERGRPLAARFAHPASGSSRKDRGWECWFLATPDAPKTEGALQCRTGNWKLASTLT